MHQWWGDNVSEDKYERTFFKEGYADLVGGLQHRAHGGERRRRHRHAGR